MATPLDDLGFEDETETLKALGFEEEAPLREDWGDAGGARAEPVAPPLPPPARAVARPPEDPGFLRALGSSVLQGAFKQGADEAAGLLTDAAVDAVPGATWRQPDGSARPLTSEGDVYRAGRDTERRVQQGAQEHRPITAFLGNVAGDIASDVALSALGLPGVGSTPYNVATGALSGLLGSEAELTGEMATAGSAAEALAATGVGAGLGYAVPKLGAALARASPAALRGIRTALENLAVSQGRRVLLNGADSLSNRLPTSPEAVLEALRPAQGDVFGPIVPFGTTQGAFRRLERLAEERGANYGSVLDDLEAAGVQGPAPLPIAAQLTAQGDDLVRRTGADEGVPNVWLSEAAKLERLAQEPQAVELAARLRQALQGVDLPQSAPVEQRLGLRQTEDIKRALQSRARYGTFEDTPLNDARRDVASVLRQANEDAVAEAGAAAPAGSDVANLAESFVPLKQQLGRTIEARDAAERGATRAAQRRGLSLTDYMAAGMGSGLTDKLSLATLNNFLRTRGTSAVASGAYAGSRGARTLAELAASNPEAVQSLGARLGASLGRQQDFTGGWADYFSGPRAEEQAATHFERAQQDPAYQERMRRLGLAQE